MDHVGALTAFVHAADARSFTLAGRQLGLSPSAIGKAVSRLEERLSVRLFHRSTRTITLTDEGVMFLERCRRILGEIDAAELELAQTSGAPRGKLRVSLPIVNALTVPTLTAFMQAYPEVQLDLDFGDRLVDVIEEGFDAVIRAGDISEFTADEPCPGRISASTHRLTRLSCAGNRATDTGRTVRACLPSPPVCDKPQVRAMAASTQWQGPRNPFGCSSNRQYDRATPAHG